MKKVRNTDSPDSRIKAGPTPWRDLPGVITTRVADDMHSYEVLTLGPDATPEHLSAFLEPPPPKTFDAFVAGMREKLNSELVADGWPPPDKVVLVTQTGWRPKPEKVASELRDEHPEYRRPFRLSIGSLYIMERTVPFSRAWFLARLSDAMTRVDAVTGDARLWAIFSFARLIETCEHRAHYPKVQKAVKNRRDAAAGGQVRARALKPKSDAILAEMRRLVAKGHSVARAAELCADRGVGTSKVANVRLWNRRK